MSRTITSCFAVAIFFVFCFAAAAEEGDGTPPSGEVTYEIEGGALVMIRGDIREQVALPAKPVAFEVAEQKIYVALGEHGMAVIETDEAGMPMLSRHVPVSHGQVTGFIEVRGELWMLVDSTTAVRIAEDAVITQRSQAPVVPLASPVPGKATAAEAGGAVEAAATPSEQKSTAKIDRPIEIIDQYPGKVKLDVGTRDGVEVGDMFTVSRTEQVDRTGDEAFEGEVLVAALQVVAVNDDSALARIWRGDRVSNDDVVAAAKEDFKPSKVYPRKLNKVAEVQAAFRPIINVGTDKGFGALCDLGLTWWGNYYFISVRMQPLGFGWVENGKVVINSLLAEAGYDGRAFGVGMGLGMASVSGDMDQMLGYDGAMSSVEDSERTVERNAKWEQRTQHGFALSQIVRLGARDGLNFRVSNILIYHTDSEDEEESGFIWGGINGRFSWPLALRTDMFLEGGGGPMGYSYGAIGVFVWVRGNGDAGSVGISASAGGAGLWGERKKDNGDYVDTERLFIIGPMFSLGFNIRFGRKAG